jgi:hypothetical protein
MSGIVCEVSDWIHLAQDREQWQILVKKAMKIMYVQQLRVRKEAIIAYIKMLSRLQTAILSKFTKIICQYR